MLKSKKISKAILLLGATSMLGVANVTTLSPVLVSAAVSHATPPENHKRPPLSTRPHHGKHDHVMRHKKDMGHQKTVNSTK